MSAVGLDVYVMHYPPPSLHYTPFASNVGSFRKMSDQTSTAQWKPVRFYGYLTTRAQPPCDFNMSRVMTLPYPYLLYRVYFRFACKVVNLHAIPYMSRFWFYFMSISVLCYGYCKTVASFFIPCLYPSCAMVG